MGVASGFLILSIYSIVAGWALAYIIKAMVGFSGSKEFIEGQFDLLSGSVFNQSFWHTIFMLLCIGIVIGGVQRGIERWSKILMPALIAILLGLMIYGLGWTNGGDQAIAFLFNADFSRLTADGVLSALGHAFFTLSLGMGAMITYGSYMRREESLLRDAFTISVLDTLIALMAGIAIFSLVFHYGMQPGQEEGLIFKTLPVLFVETGRWISVPFFFLLAFAALTSGISLLEVVVSYFIDHRGWSRARAALIMGGLIWVAGVIATTSGLFFKVLNVATTNYMLPIGGFLIALFVAWTMKDKDRVKEFGSRGAIYKLLIIFLKFITPLAVLIVILHGLKLLPFMDYGP
jgi:NSS family neurotransmitter:Na+ symporter